MKTLVFATSMLALLAGLGSAGVSSRNAGNNPSKSNQTRDRFVSGRVLVKFREKVLPDHARQIVAAIGARDADEIEGIGVHIVDLPSQANERSFVQAFLSRPEVEFAELDQILPPEQMIPNDPLYDNPNSWSLPKIDAPGAWLINTGNANLTIAIIDSGVDGTHPDLASQMVPGWNFYNNNADTSDVYGHGTAVAGVAAATSNNGVGVSSIAWGCRIMPLRVSDTTGWATASAIASGLSWAADHGARIANVSFYVTGNRTVSSAAKYFLGKGGLVIVAAGNYGVSETVADDANLVTVGATDSADVLFSWSNRGTNLDLVAPGNVYTTVRGGIYGVAGGTSFASPVVAGVAALVLSTKPSLTPKQIETILKQNADDLGAPGWDLLYGYGRINASRAVSAAMANSDPSDTVPPSIAILSPGSGASVSGTVTVEVATSDDVGVRKGELYVDGVLVATSTTAPFNLKWNSRKAKAGQHSLYSKAYDAAGNVGASQPITVYK